MPHRAGPLRTPADLEQALAEAKQLLPGVEKADPAAAKRFEELLRLISEYRGSDAPPQGPEHAKAQALDGHLKDFGRRWRPETKDERPHHWSFMFGGDLNPKRTSRG